MRPGLVAGRYPERSERESGSIDRAFSALQGKLAQLNIRHRAGLRKVSTAIGRQAEAMAAGSRGGTTRPVSATS